MAGDSQGHPLAGERGRRGSPRDSRPGAADRAPLWEETKAGGTKGLYLGRSTRGLAGDHAFFSLFFWKAQGVQLSSAENNQELAAHHGLLTHGDEGRNFWLILVIVVETHWAYTLFLQEDFGPIEAMVLLCLEVQGLPRADGPALVPKAKTSPLLETTGCSHNYPMLIAHLLGHLSSYCLLQGAHHSACL